MEIAAEITCLLLRNAGQWNNGRNAGVKKRRLETARRAFPADHKERKTV
jgi:hypothetical protein